VSEEREDDQIMQEICNLAKRHNLAQEVMASYKEHRAAGCAPHLAGQRALYDWDIA
jgi:hypothetical protein